MSEPTWVLTPKKDEPKKAPLLARALAAIARWLWGTYRDLEWEYPRTIAVLTAAAYIAAWFAAPAHTWWMPGAGWWNVAVVAASPVGAGVVAGLRVWRMWPRYEDAVDDRVATWNEVVA